MVKKIEIGLLLMLPLVVLGVVLLKPALVVQRVQVLPLSAVERREYKGMDTKVVVEVKHTPSLIPRPFSKGSVEGGGLDGTYLVDATGRKHSWRNVLTNFGRRGRNFLVTYPLPLNTVPKSAGKVTFVSKFALDKEWKSLPLSVVVRP